MTCQEKSRLWAPLVPSFPVRVRREAGLSAGRWTALLSDSRVGPVGGGEASCPSVEMKGQALARSRWAGGHSAGFNPEGRWLERQINFYFFSCFSCFRFQLAHASNAELFFFFLFLLQHRPFCLFGLTADQILQICIWPSCWPPSNLTPLMKRQQLFIDRKHVALFQHLTIKLGGRRVICRKVQSLQQEHVWWWKLHEIVFLFHLKGLV